MIMLPGLSRVTFDVSNLERSVHFQDKVLGLKALVRLDQALSSPPKTPKNGSLTPGPANRSTPTSSPTASPNNARIRSR